MEEGPDNPQRSQGFPSDWWGFSRARLRTRRSQPCESCTAGRPTRTSGRHSPASPSCSHAPSWREQARKIQNLLEAQGAILEIAYEPAGATQGAPPAPRPSTGIPAATPPLRAPARPAPSTPARSAGLADFPPTPSREAPSTPMPSGVPGKPPGRERRAKPRLHPGIQLAPMSVGEILDRSFRLLRERFWTYLIIMVIPLAVIALSMVILGGVFAGMLGGIALGQGPSLGSILGLIFVGSIVLCISSQCRPGPKARSCTRSPRYLGHETGIKAAYGATLSILMRLVGTILLLGVLLILVTAGAGIVSAVLFWMGSAMGAGILNLLLGLIGVLVLIVPALWLLLNWMLADKVVVLEGLGGWQALTRSKELMSAQTEPGFWKGPKVKATVLTLVAGIVAIGILVVFEVPNSWWVSSCPTASGC